MQLRKSAVSILILIITATLNIPRNKAQEPHYQLDLELDKLYDVRGGSMGISVSSNASQVNVQIFDPDNVKIYDEIWDSNTSRNIPIASDQDYGVYKVKGVAGESVVTSLFTVLDISGWFTPSFPYEVSHNNMDYVFYSNWTVKVQLYDDFMWVDFRTLRELAEQYNLETHPRANNMNFRVRFKHPTQPITVDFDFAFIHLGTKLVINGTLDQSRDIKLGFTAKQLNKWLEGLKSTHIVFDWSDLLKHEQAFNYDPETHELIAHCPQTFRLDPAIFEDGFESGDFSAWTGTSGNPAIVGSPIHHGSYAAECGTGQEYIWKDFTAVNPAYARIYIQFDALPTGGSADLKITMIRRVGTGTSPEIRLANVAGTVKWRILGNDGAYHTADSPLPQVDTWYCVELGVIAGSFTKLYLDGAEILSGGATSGDTFDRVYTGRWNNLDTINAYIDCVVIDDAYIGPEAAGEEYYRTASQSISWGGATYRSWSLQRLISQSISLSGVQYRVWSLSRTMSQSLTFAANSYRTWSLSRIATQSLSLAFEAIGELTVGGVQYFRTVTQGLTFSWAAYGYKGIKYFRTAIQSITTSWNAWGRIPTAFLFNLLVIDTENRDIEGAYTHLWNGTILVFSRQTNASGRIPQQTLKPGNYTLLVTKENYQTYSYILRIIQNTYWTATLSTIEEGAFMYLPFTTIAIIASVCTFLSLYTDEGERRALTSLLASILWFACAALWTVDFAETSKGVFTWVWVAPLSITFIIFIDSALDMLGGSFKADPFR